MNKVFIILYLFAFNQLITAQNDAKEYALQMLLIHGEIDTLNHNIACLHYSVTDTCKIIGSQGQIRCPYSKASVFYVNEEPMFARGGKQYVIFVDQESISYAKFLVRIRPKIFKQFLFYHEFN